MEPLINFRLLADELSSTEFILFLKTIASTTNGRQQILKGLFQQNITKPDAIITHNQVISTIINKRDNTGDQSIDIDATCKLINLPYALTSECASYLEIHEYFKFARCDRKTYLALN